MSANMTEDTTAQRTAMTTTEKTAERGNDMQSNTSTEVVPERRADRKWRGRAFLGASLDGCIAGPGGDLAFLESEPGKGAHVAIETAHPALVWETFFPQIDTLLMGKTTYEKVLTFGPWPYPGLRVLVLSSSLPADQPNAQVVRSIAEAIGALDAQGVSEVYIDGGRTVQEFLALGLIDELTVSTLPVVIGGGTRLFADGAQAEFAVRART